LPAEDRRALRVLLSPTLIKLGYESRADWVDTADPAIAAAARR
jgi:hypothetical protein